MKSLAGANPEAKPDYRNQALSDLNKLEQKVILLTEMLDNVDTTRGERFVSGDAYDVSLACSYRNRSQIYINSSTLASSDNSLICAP